MPDMALFFYSSFRTRLSAGPSGPARKASDPESSSGAMDPRFRGGDEEREMSPPPACAGTGFAGMTKEKQLSMSF